MTLLACCSTLAGTARADFIVDVTVDTSSIKGSNGYLDFQLNPGGGTAEALKAVISQYQQTQGSLASTSLNTGDAVGTLPASLTLDNGTAFNDIFQGTTFGTSF